MAKTITITDRLHREVKTFTVKRALPMAHFTSNALIHFMRSTLDAEKSAKKEAK